MSYAAMSTVAGTAWKVASAFAGGMSPAGVSSRRLWNVDRSMSSILQCAAYRQM